MTGRRVISALEGFIKRDRPLIRIGLADVAWCLTEQPFLHHADTEIFCRRRVAPKRGLAVGPAHLSLGDKLSALRRKPAQRSDVIDDGINADIVLQPACDDI